MLLIKFANKTIPLPGDGMVTPVISIQNYSFKDPGTLGNVTMG